MWVCVSYGENPSQSQRQQNSPLMTHTAHSRCFFYEPTVKVKTPLTTYIQPSWQCHIVAIINPATKNNSPSQQPKSTPQIRIHTRAPYIVLKNSKNQ